MRDAWKIESRLGFPVYIETPEPSIYLSDYGGLCVGGHRYHDGSYENVTPVFALPYSIWKRGPHPVSQYIRSTITRYLRGDDTHASAHLAAGIAEYAENIDRSWKIACIAYAYTLSPSQLALLPGELAEFMRPVRPGTSNHTPGSILYHSAPDRFENALEISAPGWRDRIVKEVRQSAITQLVGFNPSLPQPSLDRLGAHFQPKHREDLPEAMRRLTLSYLHDVFIDDAKRFTNADFATEASRMPRTRSQRLGEFETIFDALPSWMQHEIHAAPPVVTLTCYANNITCLTGDPHHRNARGHSHVENGVRHVRLAGLSLPTVMEEFAHDIDQRHKFWKFSSNRAYDDLTNLARHGILEKLNLAIGIVDHVHRGALLEIKRHYGDIDAKTGRRIFYGLETTPLELYALCVRIEYLYGGRERTPLLKAAGLDPALADDGRATVAALFPKFGEAYFQFQDYVIGRQNDPQAFAAYDTFTSYQAGRIRCENDVSLLAQSTQHQLILAGSERRL